MTAAEPGARRRPQTGWTLPAPPSRKTSSMRWCRSCIRTSPSPRSTMRSRTTSGVVSSRISTSIRRPSAGRALSPASTSAWPSSWSASEPALHLDQQAAGAVQEVARWPRIGAACRRRGPRRGRSSVPARRAGARSPGPRSRTRCRCGAPAPACRRATTGRARWSARPAAPVAGRGRAPAPASPAASCRWSSRRSGGSAPRPGPTWRSTSEARSRAAAYGSPDIWPMCDDEVARGHVGGQAVVLGHVAHQRADPRALGRDVVAEHPGGPAVAGTGRAGS